MTDRASNKQSSELRLLELATRARVTEWRDRNHQERHRRGRELLLRAEIARRQHGWFPRANRQWLVLHHGAQDVIRHQAERHAATARCRRPRVISLVPS